MKIIEYISEKIEDEIDDAADYAKHAILERDLHPWLGELLYTLSTEETRHRGMLHDAVVRLIKEYRDRVGEPPDDMMARYNYLHNKHIDDAKEAKLFQMMYKEG